MKPFFNNRLADAVAKTLLCYAVIHIFNMAVNFVMTGNGEIINGFEILGFALYFPGIEKGTVSFLLSWLLMGLIYLAVYFKLTKKT